jgi:hypothetical protein
MQRRGGAARAMAHPGTSTLLDSLCPYTPPLPLPHFTTCSAFLLHLLYLSTHLPAYSSISSTSIRHWLCCARGCVTVRCKRQTEKEGTIPLSSASCRDDPAQGEPAQRQLQSPKCSPNSKGLTIVELGPIRASNRCLSSVRGGVAVSTSSWP